MEYNYISYGQGDDTLVLLHYFGGNAQSWDWVVKRLVRHFKIFVITLPGFGNTQPFSEPSINNFANYINDCIAHLQLKTYILCGHSMSAKLILYSTQINRGFIPKGLILIAPSPPTVEQIEENERNRMLKHPNEVEAIQTVKNSTTKNLKNRKFNLAVASQLEADPGTWNWWIESGMCNNIADRIQGVKIPIYVICAKKDPVISMEAIYNGGAPTSLQTKTDTARSLWPSDTFGST